MEMSSRPAFTPDQRSALGRLTIVVPSRNRQDYLFRLVAQWGGTPVHLVFLDGSDEPVSDRSREFVEGVGNVEYVHRVIGWPERMRLAKHHLARPYAVMCGDDEFLLPPGLASAIELLDRESGMVGCVGQTLRFFPTRRFRRLAFEAGYDYWRPRATDDDPVARIQASMVHYDAATCYAVLRHDVWAASWGSVEAWSTPAPTEVQQALAVHARGLVGVVDDLYWLRSEENPPVDRHLRKLTLGDWWRSADHADERERYIDRVGRDLALAMSLDDDGARTVVEDAVDALVASTDRRNEAAGWVDGRPPVRGRGSTLEMTRELSERFLPDALHLALGDSLEAGRRFTGRSAGRRYGGVRRVERWCPDRLREATPDLSTVLGRVEGVVRSFHQERTSGREEPGR